MQAEQEELERIIQVETDKYSKRRDDRLQEIQSQATDFAQDMMQDGIKDMALQNIIMKRVSPPDQIVNIIIIIIVNITWHIYRVAQKECNTYDQWFEENEGQNKQAVSIIAYKVLFPARWHQDH